MTLSDYQKKAMTTCLSTSENFSYMFLNLVGEIGEFASKVAKFIRKDKAHVNHDILYLSPNGEIPTEEIEDLRKEIGDVMWQVAGVCTVMGWSLEDVCQENLDKLASRKERKVIDGNGDSR